MFESKALLLLDLNYNGKIYRKKISILNRYKNFASILIDIKYDRLKNSISIRIDSKNSISIDKILDLYRY